MISVPYLTRSIICDIHFGTISYADTVSSGFNMALEDFAFRNLYNIDYFTSNILSLNKSCRIRQNMNDINRNINTAIFRAFELGQSFGEINSSYYTNIPIVIGPPSSSFVSTLYPLIEAFGLIEFSSAATSTHLSEYDHFFRSISSDDLQGHTLIKLCKYFNWRNIGILHENTIYGSSLQQAITLYAKNNDIQSTSFSFISDDNITRSDAVEAMKQSGIYIHIIIAFNNDLTNISKQIIKHNMESYPYYYLGSDSWINNVDITVKDNPSLLDIFGGSIGSCPWSPSSNDSFINQYQYPINESIKMYNQFKHRWHAYYLQNRTDIVYNEKEPGFFTFYAYDNVLTVIKTVDEYIKRYVIGTQFSDNNINYFLNDSNITAKFKEILHSIWFIGLTGNVSYDIYGDRSNGLFSVCNFNPNTQTVNKIGYVVDNEDNITFNIDDTLIVWPNNYVQRGIEPKYEYIVYKGIPNYLFIVVFICTSISILFAFMLIVLVFIYRNRKIIKSSQWKLNCIMCIGIIITYITIIMLGIDETIDPNHSINWRIFCNLRVISLNTSFILSFCPLFFKVYRIRKTFNLNINETNNIKITAYNLAYILFAIDFIICVLLIIIIPNERVYKENSSYNIERELYGNCLSENYGVYLLLLVLPKMVLIIYSMVISISVYSAVSMVKFTEGLRVLMTVILTSLLIFTVTISAFAMTANSEQTVSFFYGFLSFILLFVANFILIMMLLPRLVTIWRGKDVEYLSNYQHIEMKTNKYVEKIKAFKRRKTQSDDQQLQHLPNKQINVGNSTPSEL